jgi:hypothetical protein
MLYQAFHPIDHLGPPHLGDEREVALFAANRLFEG